MNRTTALFILFSHLCCTPATSRTEEAKVMAASSVQNINRTKIMALSAKAFIKKKNYNPDCVFLIDMSLSSGKKRFYVYDLKADTVLFSGLVAHGSCNTRGLTRAVYSNEKNSGCSSIGKYKVGYRYAGRFGASYKLYGLDPSNRNAFDRAIVLHSYDCVPDYEMMTEAPICNSLGCPMVSPNFFSRLQEIIDTSKKPLLLRIYD